MEAINDILKAIAASLLMEHFLAPRFNFTPKRPDSRPIEGFDYGEGAYDPDQCNLGISEESGHFQIEIKGFSEPKTKEAERNCQEDMNEVIAAFVQEKPTVERGMLVEELAREDQETVRQHGIMNYRYNSKAASMVKA